MRSQAAALFSMLAMALFLMAFWLFRPLPAPPQIEGLQQVVELAPSQTRRGERSLREHVPLGTPLALPPWAQHVVVHLGPADYHWRSHQAPSVPRAGEFFPASDEVPLPDSEAAGALAEALRVESLHGAEGDDMAASAVFLRAARADRLDPTELRLADDPWRALLAMEAELRRARAVMHQQRSEGRADVRYQGEFLDQLARRVVAAHDKASAAVSYAALYRLITHCDPNSDLFTPPRCARYALDVLSEVDDDFVRGHAAGALGRLPPEPMLGAESLRPYLDAAAARSPWLASFALREVSLSGEWDDALLWAEALALAAQALCDRDGATASCHGWRQEVVEASAKLRALRGLEASQWRGAVTQAAWKCHLWMAPQVDANGTVIASFDSRWSFDDWQGLSGTFAECVTGEAWWAPSPGRRTQVQVQIVSGGQAEAGDR